VASIYAILADLLAGAPAPTIIEIGAHHGHDTVELRALFPRATIYAFEPDPRNIFRLKRSGVHKAVHLVEAAVGDTDGSAQFLLSSGRPPVGDPHYTRGQPNEPWSYSSSLKPPVKHLENVPWVRFETKATVPVVRLDTFCAAHGIDAIDFVWADVQGAEDLLIAGGQAALARTSYLYTEYSEEEIYKGQLDLGEIVRRLPGRWEVLADFAGDALLRNASKLGPLVPPKG